MNPKIWIPLSAAAVTGVGAAWVGHQLVSQRPEVARVEPIKLDQVVVAARALPAGSRLTAEDLRLLRVEPGSLRGDTATDIKALVGRVISDPIARGQLMNGSVLAAEGVVPGLIATLPKGYRAITIRVDRFSGLEGFLFPEARVDIVASLGNGNDAAARTVAQNLRVLAVEGRLHAQPVVDDGNDAAKVSSDFNVTLMVTPEQAAAIELACSSGSPRLTLRAGGDNELSAFEGITLADLRGEKPAEGIPTGGDPFAVDPLGSTVSQETPVEPSATVTAVVPTGEQSVEPPVEASAEPQPQPQPRFHIIEIIRGGVITRTSMPVGGGPRSRRPEEQAVVKTDTNPAAE